MASPSPTAAQQGNYDVDYVIRYCYGSRGIVFLPATEKLV